MSKYISDKKGSHVLGTRFLDNSNMSLFEATAHNFDCFHPKTSRKPPSAHPTGCDAAQNHRTDQILEQVFDDRVTQDH